MIAVAAADAAAAAADAVELEVLRHKLLAIAAEMGVTLEHTARTAEVNVGRDCAVAIVDRAGGVAATDNPLQLSPIAETAAAVLDYFKFDMKDGDVVLISDPYRGGTHVQDVTLLSPHVIDNRIVLYLVARAHMSDMGGQTPTSYNPTATEIWAEGVPIAPLKLYRFGQPVRDVMSTFLLNSRHPDQTRGNLDAQLAAIELGRRRVSELIGRHGAGEVAKALAYAQDYSERRTREVVQRCTDGEYAAERLLDHDCAGGTDVAVRARALFDGERLVIDLSESDDQRPSFVNSTRANTVGFALLPILALLGDDVPANGGVLRAVEVRTRPGSLVDPLAPAPVGWAHAHPGLDVADATAAALSEAAPGELTTLSAPAFFAMLAADHKAHARIDLAPLTVAGRSASPACDGWGRPGPESRAAIPSVEVWESDTGLVVRSMELVADSGGPGERRGAPAVETVLELREPMVATVCVEGVRHTARGSAGACDGGAGRVALDDGAEIADVAVERPLGPGVLRLRRGGGGGYGDPLERDAALVARDVVDGYVSPQAARSDYGVVVDAACDVDVEATDGLRAGR